MKKYAYIVLAVVVIALVGVGIGKTFTDGTPVNIENVENFNLTLGGAVDTEAGAGLIGGTTNIDALELDSDLTINGVTQGWYTGSCIDASTTAFAVLNPWEEDVIIDKVVIDMTNGTTSITFDVGTSSTAYAAPSEAFADDVSVSTSSVIRLINTNTTSSAAYGFTDPGTNSQENVFVRDDEYINLVATEIGTTGGITGGANTFSCSYAIHRLK